MLVSKFAPKMQDIFNQSRSRRKSCLFSPVFVTCKYEISAIKINLQQRIYIQLDGANFGSVKAGYISAAMIKIGTKRTMVGGGGSVGRNGGNTKSITAMTSIIIIYCIQKCLNVRFLNGSFSSFSITSFTITIFSSIL